MTTPNLKIETRLSKHHRANANLTIAQLYLRDMTIRIVTLLVVNHADTDRCLGLAALLRLRS